jgi:hypothetical protein
MTVLGFYWARKIIKIEARKIFVAFGKSLLAAILMGVAVFYLKIFLNVFIVAALGGIIYITLLLIFKTITKNEILHVCHSFLKK